MRMRWAEYAECMTEKKCIQNSGRKTEGKTPFRIPWRRWVDNIRMDIREIGLWTKLILIRTGTSGKLFGTW